VVSDQLIERPTLYVTRPQAKKEVKEEAPVEKRGWQEAVLTVYPVEINEFKVQEADVTYLDMDPSRPIHLQHLNLTLSNIRNIRSKGGEYPSEVHVDGTLADSGRIVVDGRADFFAIPHVGIQTDALLERVTLDQFLPLAGQ
jgi:hypothetical protein